MIYIRSWKKYILILVILQESKSLKKRKKERKLNILRKKYICDANTNILVKKDILVHLIYIAPARTIITSWHMAKNHNITSLLRREVFRVNSRRKFSILQFLFSNFPSYWNFWSGLLRVTSMKILNNFQEILKLYYNILLSVFIPTNPFHSIPKFTLVTFSIKNLFYILLFFIVDDNWSLWFINLIW